MFLALRDVEEHIYRHHKSAQSLLPASICKRIHNVHHPSDPVVSLCAGVCVCACMRVYMCVCLWYMFAVNELNTPWDLLNMVTIMRWAY